MTCGVWYWLHAVLRGAREEASGYIGMFSLLWTSLVAMRGVGILLRQLDDIMALIDVCMYIRTCILCGISISGPIHTRLLYLVHTA